MNKYRYYRILNTCKKREFFNKISVKYSVIVTILDIDDQFMMIIVRLQLKRAIFSQKYVNKKVFLEIEISKKKQKCFFLESLTVYHV